MPYSCCIPNCNSNYSNKQKREDNVSVFGIPSDPERKALWERKIPRKNFVFSQKAKVCIKHFRDEHIKRLLFISELTRGLSSL